MLNWAKIRFHSLHPALYFLLLLAIALWPHAAHAGYIPLPNPGFEIDSDNNGFPDGWAVGFGHIYDRTGVKARTGQAAVFINANARFVTDVAPPPLAALTLRGWMRADQTAGNVGVLQIHQFNGPHFVDLYSRQYDLTTTYTLCGVNMRPHPEVTRFLPFFRGGGGQTWAWFDDMDLLTDRVDNGSLEQMAGGAPAAWTPAGMPTLDAVGGVTPQSPTAVVCNSANYFFQPIACSPSARSYTLEFKVRAAAPAAAAIRIKWFDGRGQPIAQTDLPFQVAADWARAVHHFTAPPQAVWGEVALQPESQTWFWFDEIYLGFQNAAPPVFTPNDDGINDVATLYYSLPYDAHTTVTLLTAQGVMAATLSGYSLQTAGLQTAVIEGLVLDFLAEGPYRFRVEVARAGDAPWAAELPVELRQIPGWVEQIHPVAENFFAIGIWEYVFGIEFATFSSFADLIERAADWNFNAALMLFLKESDFDAAYAAAEGSPIQALTNNYLLTNIIDNRRWPEGFDEFAARDLLLDYSTRFGANPNWLAVYLKDEPLRRDTENVRAAFRIADNAAPAQMPLSVFSVNGDAEYIAGRVRPPIVKFDYYPVSVATALGPDAWTQTLPAFALMRSVAAGIARPWWLTTQAFFNGGGRRPVLPAEQRALAGLALAHGAKGLLYFIRSTFGGNEGMLDVDFEQTDMLPEIIAQNARLRSLAPLLLTLQPAAIPVTLDDPQCLAAAFTDDRGAVVIVLVNKNTMLPRACRVTMQMMGDDTVAQEVRFNEAGERIATPLPRRIAGDQMTLAPQPLAPGDWMIIEAGPADVIDL